MVPELLRGCWRRSWIRYADGSVDDASIVVWLQLVSAMADVRVPATHAGLAGRGSLGECSLDELRALAASESSCGFTRCTPIEHNRATAEWFSADGDVAFQPVTAFPEPGLLEWSADGTVMIERAPSGAYTEEWRRVDGTDAPLVHHLLDAGRQLYVAGEVAVFVRDRVVPLPRVARLEQLVADAGDDRAAIEALVDCEFSVAQQGDDCYVITASTLPWRMGEVLDVAV